jgi:ankyrin repeat protein
MMQPAPATCRKSRRCSETNLTWFSAKKAGGTPLHCAAKNGHKGVAELLLANQADLNANDDNYSDTPLHWAAKNGQKSAASLCSQPTTTSAGDSYKVPPDERGGNGYVQPKTTARHLDSTLLCKNALSRDALRIIFSV